MLFRIVTLIALLLTINKIDAQKEETELFQAEFREIKNLLSVHNYIAASNKLIAIEKRIDSVHQVIEFSQFLKYQIELQNGLQNYEKRCHFQRIFESYLNDNLLQANRMAMSKVVENSYQLNKKEKEVASLTKNIDSRWILIQYFTLICVMVLIGLYGLKKVNQTLRAADEEKGLLIKEIHHRVKNNLQVVSSLLNLQGKYLFETSSKKMLKINQIRVDSIGLIHQNLYLGKDMDGINMKEYIIHLEKSIEDTYEVNDAFEFENCIEIESLKPGIAIYIGLIVNEIICNFISSRSGEGTGETILVKLFFQNTQTLKLEMTCFFQQGNYSVSHMNEMDAMLQMLSGKLDGIFYKELWPTKALISFEFAKF